MTRPPYLRGAVGDEPLTVSAWLRGLEDVRETLERWAGGLPPEGFWWTPGPPLNSVGGLLRHIAGASERLLAYALGEETEALRRSAAEELRASEEAPEALLGEALRVLAAVEARLGRLEPAQLEAVRPVGRAAVPAQAAFILHHLVEHAQHHAGQVIVMRKLWELQGPRG